MHPELAAIQQTIQYGLVLVGFGEVGGFTRLWEWVGVEVGGFTRLWEWVGGWVHQALGVGGGVVDLHAA